jgi:hypothetical protein
MAQTNTQLSIEIMYRLKEFLNNEIRQNGEIQINNKRIWDGWLHKMNNEVWAGILETMQTLSHQHPELFNLHQHTAIEDGLKLLNKYSDYYDNVLDMNNKHVKAKGVAWKCLHTVREVWNECVNDLLPNLDSSRVTSTYGDMFE